MGSCIVDLELLPEGEGLASAFVSALPTLLDVRWNKARIRGRWRRFEGDLSELDRGEGAALEATSAAGHRLEIDGRRARIGLAGPGEIMGVAERLPSFLRACPVELDLGAVRAVGECAEPCPGRFAADALVDVATERSFDLHVDPPGAWEALASDPLPPGARREVADGLAVVVWTEAFDEAARQQALGVRARWLRRVLGGHDVLTGATPEPPCRPAWHPPDAWCEVLVSLQAPSIAAATRIVRRLADAAPGRPWPAALGDSPAPFEVRTGRAGKREHVLQLLALAPRPRSAPRITFVWTADRIVVRRGPLPDAEREPASALLERLIEVVRDAPEIGAVVHGDGAATSGPGR